MTVRHEVWRELLIASKIDLYVSYQVFVAPVAPAFAAIRRLLTVWHWPLTDTPCAAKAGSIAFIAVARN